MSDRSSIGNVSESVPHQPTQNHKLKYHIFDDVLDTSEVIRGFGTYVWQTSGSAPVTAGITTSWLDHGPVDKLTRNQISVEDVEGGIAVHVNRRLYKAKVEQIPLPYLHQG